MKTVLYMQKLMSESRLNNNPITYYW